MIKNSTELHNGYKQRMAANHIFDKEQLDNHWENTNSEIEFVLQEITRIKLL